MFLIKFHLKHHHNIHICVRLLLRGEEKGEETPPPTVVSSFILATLDWKPTEAVYFWAKIIAYLKVKY